MTDLVRARVEGHLVRLRLGAVAGRLDAILPDAARKEPSYLAFLVCAARRGARRQAEEARCHGNSDRALPRGENARRLRPPVPAVVDAKLVRELATGRFIATAENVLLFGPPGVGKTHLAIALGRAAIETGHSVLFVTATALIAQLAKAHSEGRLGDQLAFYAKPKLLVIDELGYLPLERASAHVFFQLVTRRCERGSILLTTNQPVTEWGHVFGDEMIAAAVLDRLLHHSHTLVIHGESYRLKQQKKAGLLTPRKA